MRVRLILLAVAGLLLASIAVPSVTSGALGNPRTAYLTTDTSISMDGVYHDIVAVNLNVGTWVVSGSVAVGLNGSGSAACALTDGTAVIASAPFGSGQMNFSGFVVASSGTVLRIACRSFGGTVPFYADPDQLGYGFGLGTTQTYVSAYRVP